MLLILIRFVIGFTVLFMAIGTFIFIPRGIGLLIGKFVNLSNRSDEAQDGMPWLTGFSVIATCIAAYMIGYSIIESIG